jgi:ATP-dependent Clp protease ATP-binding subunit ClpC
LEKHDIDLIIEIELKKLYTRVSELGYNLTSRIKRKHLLQKKVLTDRTRPLKEPFKNMLKMHLPKRLLPLKLLQVMIFSWTLKKELRN